MRSDTTCLAKNTEKMSEKVNYLSQQNYDLKVLVKELEEMLVQIPTL